MCVDVKNQWYIPGLELYEGGTAYDIKCAC